MDQNFNDLALSAWCNGGKFVVLVGAVPKKIIVQKETLKCFHFLSSKMQERTDFVSSWLDIVIKSVLSS